MTRLVGTEKMRSSCRGRGGKGREGGGDGREGERDTKIGTHTLQGQDDRSVSRSSLVPLCALAGVCARSPPILSVTSRGRAHPRPSRPVSPVSPGLLVFVSPFPSTTFRALAPSPILRVSHLHSLCVPILALPPPLFPPRPFPRTSWIGSTAPTPRPIDSKNRTSTLLLIPPISLYHVMNPLVSAACFASAAAVFSAAFASSAPWARATRARSSATDASSRVMV